MQSAEIKFGVILGNLTHQNNYLASHLKIPLSPRKSVLDCTAMEIHTHTHTMKKYDTTMFTELLYQPRTDGILAGTLSNVT